MEQETMCAVVSGQSRSVREVMNTYGKTVFHLAVVRCRCTADAEDIFQEVFLKLCGKERCFDTEDHLKAWLIRLTVNASTNLFRSAWRRHVVLAEYLPERFPEEPPLPSRQKALRRALQKLPRTDRVVLYLHYYEKMTSEEIAEMLEEKPTTIRSRLSRGRRKLREMITREEAQEHAGTTV